MKATNLQLEVNEDLRMICFAEVFVPDAEKAKFTDYTRKYQQPDRNDLETDGQHIATSKYLTIIMRVRI